MQKREQEFLELRDHLVFAQEVAWVAQFDVDEIEPLTT